MKILQNVTKFEIDFEFHFYSSDKKEFFFSFGHKFSNFNWVFNLKKKLALSFGHKFSNFNPKISKKNFA